MRTAIVAIAECGVTFRIRMLPCAHRVEHPCPVGGESHTPHRFQSHDICVIEPPGLGTDHAWGEPEAQEQQGV